MHGHIYIRVYCNTAITGETRTQRCQLTCIYTQVILTCAVYVRPYAYMHYNSHVHCTKIDGSTPNVSHVPSPRMKLNIRQYLWCSSVSITDLDPEVPVPVLLKYTYSVNGLRL